jgi:hypothetical protein
MSEKTDIETRSGHCSTHGQVEATRSLPAIRFPFVYYSVARMLAKRRPFQCPTCGSTVSTG